MKKLLLILAACVVGVTVGAIATEPAETSDLQDQTHHVHAQLVDCSQVSIPVNSDVHDVFDEESGTLTIEYLNGDTTNTIAVNVREPACRADPGIRAAINRAEQAAREHRVGACAFLRDFLKTDKTTVRGRAVNRAAGQSYVARNC